MPDIGHELQRARLEKNITLEELSGRTHIANKYLKALETGDYRVFPGEVYLRGALRKYAEEVGLSPVQVIAWYEAASMEKEPQKVIEKKEIPHRETPREVIRKEKNPATGRLIVFILCVILIFTSGYFLFTFFSEREAGPDDITPPPVAEEPADNEPGEIDTDPPDIVEIPAVTIERDSDPGAVRYNVRGTQSLQLTLSFTERCWVRVTADGVQVADENFRAGMKYSAVADREIILNVGYPAGLHLKINEQYVEIPDSKNPYTIKIVLID